MANDALSLLMKQMEDEIKDVAAAILDGSCRDFAEYRWMAGRIYGLKVAQRTVGEMEKRLQEAEE